MPRLALLTWIWLSFAVVHSIPYAYAIEERQTWVWFDRYHRAFPNLKIDGHCDNTQVLILQRAWEESKLLAKAQTGNVSGYDYDLVHKTWLGQDWNRTGKPLLAYYINHRTRSIAKNFEQLKRLYDGIIAGTQWIYWWCHDPGAHCQANKKDYSTIAESWIDKSSGIREIYHTVWCPLFFEQETLENQITRTKNNIADQVILDNFELNSAVTMYHETFHYDNLVGYPSIKDTVFYADQCYQLAKVIGTEKAYVNADSYTVDALAIYIQQKFQLSSPPLPRFVIEGTKPPDLKKWE
ncbi:Metalloproteases (zincins), catalytic [Glarea lozoyensis ATCC 20868]|uniref:Metalloproteases (Zincins), catalytic n=1 Tax=Glarea lozoyensis (strain ATCC 20868 / MF5171) TaxID=1116229 RepID=S3D0B7_GLAL2|nr:Metalloproteases (zincins), catalytic [Glarea lozoyensis ATCC 20868]EPE25506.1 Metalloproteases (zincins), catalytic [Glarea lozoyensis ATCC 20868]